METFLEYETKCRDTPPGHVFVGSSAEIDPRKMAEVVRGSRHKRSLQYSAIRSDVGSPTIMNIKGRNELHQHVNYHRKCRSV